LCFIARVALLRPYGFVYLRSLSFAHESKSYMRGIDIPSPLSYPPLRRGMMARLREHLRTTAESSMRTPKEPLGPMWRIKQRMASNSSNPWLWTPMTSVSRPRSNVCRIFPPLRSLRPHNAALIQMSCLRNWNPSVVGLLRSLRWYPLRCFSGNILPQCRFQ
jgi:hypothetical protein